MKTLKTIKLLAGACLMTAGGFAGVVAVLAAFVPGHLGTILVSSLIAYATIDWGMGLADEAIEG